MEHARQGQVCWSSITNARYRYLVLLVFVRFYDGMYFVVEQVVKQAIRCTDDDISKFHLNGVLVCVIRLVQVNLICVLSQTFSKLDCFFCLTFADEGFDVLIVWINGELVGHVEVMCLIF